MDIAVKANTLASEQDKLPDDELIGQVSYVLLYLNRILEGS